MNFFIYLFIYSCVLTLDFVFKIMYHNVTRLCHTRTILSVNGQFPGPRLVAREGDRVIVKVVNHVSNNVTIHWYVCQMSCMCVAVLYIYIYICIVDV